MVYSPKSCGISFLALGAAPVSLQKSRDMRMWMWKCFLCLALWSTVAFMEPHPVEIWDTIIHSAGCRPRSLVFTASRDNLRSMGLEITNESKLWWSDTNGYHTGLSYIYIHIYICMGMLQITFWKAFSWRKMCFDWWWFDFQLKVFEVSTWQVNWYPFHRCTIMYICETDP